MFRKIGYKMESVNRELESIKITKIEILEQKIIVKAKIENQGFNSRLGIAEEGIRILEGHLVEKYTD